MVEPICVFSLGLVKGMARATLLPAMLHKTVQVVRVLHSEQATKMEEALQNMKLSDPQRWPSRTIRKKTNIIQTVTMVQRLMNHGLSDFTIFVQKWNTMAASIDQIEGKKAMALKLLVKNCDQAIQVT